MAYYHPRYSGRKRRKKTKLQKFILFTLLFLILVALVVGYMLYRVMYHPNVWLGEKEEVSVYIPHGTDFNEVKSILYSNGMIVNRRNFEWLAKQKEYPANIKPGHYVIEQGMNNNDLINMLRAGKQTPVQVVFNNINTLEELAGKVSLQLELDSATLIGLLKDSALLSKYNLQPETAASLFIPNTYEFYWTTGADEFIERMQREYNKFWSEGRKSKAKELELSIPEIVTLASIVEKETNKEEEKDEIAGVYMNRLTRGWLLQADPTLKYILEYQMGDEEIRRVLKRDKEIESPYNTYKYGGLPPGPICLPSISSIDAVLNYDDHSYFYFCAKDDLSGYHVFSKNLNQHNLNARKYQRALDDQNIYR
ncbi:MAG: endolytic transglycosylase MltG [Bacteroidales bacterium]|nr:endolytic transglycosylase MltG [Bacteroidales bacterium]MCF8343099.1 endolytic transglycosylase MltG [Bacteroidales bacterium]MCF8375361.1 endolytic transglycosylase MltG [Bacteroidales bacterium]MCF8400217.1 endolytic transglycosylase MltG [Bacteroidales bacterium]